LKSIKENLKPQKLKKYCPVWQGQSGVAVLEPESQPDMPIGGQPGLSIGNNPILQWNFAK